MVLSVRVVQMRASAKIAIGDGGNNPVMERRIRVHGNFAEYVPMALLLLFVHGIASHGRAWLIHVLCIALIAARVVHAYGVTPERKTSRCASPAG